MADAMVTARMSQSKKDAGNQVLCELGLSASQAINELYDCLLETHAWPLEPKKKSPIAAEALAQALAYIDSIARVCPDEYIDMDYHEAKRHRLIEKGYAVESDFE